MDANFARAAGRSRIIDRTLMLGEWPVLLRVMGKDGPGGRYLGLQDVIDLFRNRSFPGRMNKRLRGATQGSGNARTGSVSPTTRMPGRR